MKRRWWMVVIGVVMLNSITVTVLAEPRSECTREISVIREKYKEALQEGKISKELFLDVIEFLNATEYSLKTKDALTVYDNFPDSYIQLLYSYNTKAIEDLAVIVWELGQDAQPFIDEYNQDMRYIEEVLEIYGIKEELEIIPQEEFPALSAKG